MLTIETFAQRVERAGADIAIDDTEGAQRECGNVFWRASPRFTWRLWGGTAVRSIQRGFTAVLGRRNDFLHFCLNAVSKPNQRERRKHSYTEPAEGT